MHPFPINLPKLRTNVFGEAIDSSSPITIDPKCLPTIYFEAAKTYSLNCFGRTISIHKNLDQALNATRRLIDQNKSTIRYVVVSSLDSMPTEQIRLFKYDKPDMIEIDADFKNKENVFKYISSQYSKKK